MIMELALVEEDGVVGVIELEEMLKGAGGFRTLSLDVLGMDRSEGYAICLRRAREVL